MTQKTEKYVAIATKVSRRSFELLQRLATKHKMNVYQLMQMAADTLIRYMDDRHNLSREMERAMAVFEHLTTWHGSVNLCDPATEGRTHVTEATYYLAAEGRAGVRAVHVTEPTLFNRGATETANVQDILELTLNHLLPERYVRLRRLATAMECRSVLELIDLMIDSFTVGQLDDMRDVRAGFEDCARAENNRPVVYGERTRRKKHYSAEDLERKASPVPSKGRGGERSLFDMDRDAIGI